MINEKNIEKFLVKRDYDFTVHIGAEFVIDHVWTFDRLEAEEIAKNNNVLFGIVSEGLLNDGGSNVRRDFEKYLKGHNMYLVRVANCFYYVCDRVKAISIKPRFTFAVSRDNAVEFRDVFHMLAPSAQLEIVRKISAEFPSGEGYHMHACRERGEVSIVVPSIDAPAYSYDFYVPGMAPEEA